jgi:hypothetical protein
VKKPEVVDSYVKAVTRGVQDMLKALMLTEEKFETVDVSSLEREIVVSTRFRNTQRGLRQINIDP